MTLRIIDGQDYKTKINTTIGILQLKENIIPNIISNLITERKQLKELEQTTTLNNYDIETYSKSSEFPNNQFDDNIKIRNIKRLKKKLQHKRKQQNKHKKY